MTEARKSKHPTPIVAEWMAFIYRAAKVRRLQTWFPPVVQSRHAALLAILGSTSDAVATETFSALNKLVMHYRRIRAWAEVVKKVDPTPEALRRIVASVKAAEKIQPLDKAKFHLHYFIEVAQQLPDPEGYFNICRRDGLDTIHSIMHLNTLKYTASHYRGMFDNTEHLKELSQVKVTEV